MNLIKLKSDADYPLGKLNLPIVGVVEFDSENTIEVDEAKVDQLLAVLPSLSVISDEAPASIDGSGDEDEEGEELHKTEIDEFNEEGDTIAPQTEDAIAAEEENISEAEKTEDAEKSESEEELPKDEEKSEEEVSEEEDQSEEQKLREKLEGNTLADLKVLAANYPKDLTKDLRKKEDYVNFILQDLLAAAK